MLIIEASVGTSSIHGLGVFTKVAIKKGTIIWVAHKGFDIYYSQEQIDILPPVPRNNMLDHLYVNSFNGRLVLCGDEARYMNHSESPNLLSHLWNSEEEMKKDGFGDEVDWTEGANMAIRDIEAGEELTCNYKDFDADAKRKLGDAY